MQRQKQHRQRHVTKMVTSPESNGSPSNHVANDNQGNGGGEEMYETRCQWEGCSKEFDTQEQLVQVLINKLL